MNIIWVVLILDEQKNYIGTQKILEEHKKL